MMDEGKKIENILRFCFAHNKLDNLFFKGSIAQKL